MKLFKKLAAVVLTAALAVTALVGCGGTSVPAQVNADQIAALLNADRVAAGQQELQRSAELDAILADYAKVLAENDDNKDDNRLEVIQAASEAMTRKLEAIRIDGKKIKLGGMAYKQALVRAEGAAVTPETIRSAAKKDDSWAPMINDESASYVAVGCAESNGVTMVYMMTLTLVEA